MSALLKFARFKDLNSWSVHLLQNDNLIFTNKYPIVCFKEFVSKANIEKINIEDNKIYKILGVRSYGLGVFLNRKVLGSTLKMKTYQKAKQNHLFWCKVDTKNGAFGIVTDEFKDGLGSSNMIFAELDTNKINIDYLQLFFKSKIFNKYMDNLVVGTTNRKYIKFDDLLNDVKIPLPPLDIQKKLVKDYYDKLNLAISQEKQIKEKDDEIEKYLYKELGIIENKKVNERLLNFISFKQLDSWSYRDVINAIKIESNLYHTVKLEQNNKLYIDIYRGKSPKYDDKSNTFILNQKCIRWNEIDLRHIKKVNKDWYSNIDKKYFTQENDILINSTGDGTIGRTVCIKKQYTNLIYDSHILLLRINQQQINANFLTYYLNSSLVQKQIENIKSAVATKQTELGINNLKKLQLILPPLEIQNKIAQNIQKIKDGINILKDKSIQNKTLALEEFEREIFNG